jgi:hypothetical protein
MAYRGKRAVGVSYLFRLIKEWTPAAQIGAYSSRFNASTNSEPDRRKKRPLKWRIEEKDRWVLFISFSMRGTKWIRMLFKQPSFKRF